MSRYLVVGAGFAGAVYARILAEQGHAVELIDRRDHIAGNAYDFVDVNGIRVHRYGPHLFHTNDADVVRWLSRFTEWLPYEHRVRARLDDGRLVPLPINRETINTVFGLRLQTAEEVDAHLRKVAIPIAEPANAAEHLYAQIGRTLTDLFFRPYTKKMWAHDLEDMSASVVQRIPLRMDDEDRYFTGDRFQALPKDGYTALFERILDHPEIRVRLSTDFSTGIEPDYDHVFNSMAIDEYFDYCLGELPYRSVRFHHASLPSTASPPVSVINYTDSAPLTRETHWHILPGHLLRPGSLHTRTCEEPCDYRANGMERYYPIKTSDQRHLKLYARYKALAQTRPSMTFIGRCGTYQYLDMDQVVRQSLMGVHRFLGHSPDLEPVQSRS